MTPLSRRNILARALAGAGAVVTSTVLGAVPEAAAAVRNLRHGRVSAPWYARKPLTQHEVTGPERAAVLAVLLRSPDVANVLASERAVGRDAVQAVDREGVVIVRQTYRDRAPSLAAGIPLRDGSVVAVYAPAEAGTGGLSTALVYRPYERPEGGAGARLIDHSHNGERVLLHVRPEFAENDCATGTSPCTSCCDMDWQGLFECCGPCVFAGPTPLGLACALAWCGYCFWAKCRRSCTSCCSNYN